MTTDEFVRGYCDYRFPEKGIYREALKNWDVYGYPLDILKKMIEIAKITHPETHNFGVLDDFGLQVVSYLHFGLNVPYENITFLVSDKDNLGLVKNQFSCVPCSFYYIDNKELSNKNMLVIMNPPYGKSSSLSKKILNAIHDSGIASEIVCLAPPKTFYDKLAFVKTAVHISGLDNFGDMGYDNLNLCHLLLVEQNIYKEPADFLLGEKMSTLRSAVLEYNKSRKPFFENVNFKKWVGDDSLLFVVPIYTPAPNTGVAFAGQSWIHNVEKQPIEKGKSNYPYMMKFNSQIEYDNFSKWWYGSGRRKEKTLLNFCFDILYNLYHADPSLNKYVEVLPNLDWSRSWTDEEILEEIGLSRDFLKKWDYEF